MATKPILTPALIVEDEHKATPAGRGIRRAAASERLAGPGTKRVLELGCGSGTVAGHGTRIGQLVGYDLSQVFVAGAVAK